MRPSRREFLKLSSALALSGAPGFWQSVAQAAPPSDRSGAAETVLVVIQLSGGNDGLNTVVPFRDPEYARARPILKQSADKVLKLNDDLGLHPALKGLAGLHEQNTLCVVQGVGYPRPNRSHFVSMDIWHTAALDPENRSHGWLGRAIDTHEHLGAALHIGGGDTPLAIEGARGRAFSLNSLVEYQLKVAAQGDDQPKRRLIEGFARSRSQASELLETIRQTARETYASSERLRTVAQAYSTSVTYPNSPLANRLKLIAQFLDAGVADRVFYASLDGFDTHASQANAHAELLRTLGDAIAAFYQDLAQHGHEKRVLVATFSEFGRRVHENGSAGTDHGAASQMFLVGHGLRAGVVGAHPSLTDLDDGDLKFHTDFRQVYAALLQNWLKVAPAGIVPAEFSPLDCIAV